MISVVLATHNEAKNIEKCLDSVKDWADEIIVVDGESSDDTVKLAKKYDARIIETTNKANFHINKQMGMDAAKGELVLQLDADEAVDKELSAFIQKIHTQRFKTSERDVDTQPVAWWLKRKNLFLGKFLTKGGQYPDPVIRLYLKGRAKLPQKDVHEQMVVDGEVGWAAGHLIHYSNPTFGDYLRKFNTYTSFKAHQLYEAKLKLTLGSAFTYLVWKPLATFFSLYIRHKGLVDGLPGFVFALFSGLHHMIAYLKLWELYAQRPD
jgi:glycosyltransferase involved in cell wall biosynthesis